MVSMMDVWSLMASGWNLLSSGPAILIIGLSWFFSAILVLVHSLHRDDLNHSQKFAWILVTLLLGLPGALMYYAVSAQSRDK